MVVFLSMIAIGSTYLYGDHKVSKLEVVSSLSNQKLRIINNIQYGFLNARRNEKDFIMRGKKKYLTKHAEGVSQIKTQILELKTILLELKMFKHSVESAEHLKNIENHFLEYVTQFSLIAANIEKRGLSHNLGLEGNLRKSVHRIEMVLKQFEQPDLMVIMLMMRRHEKDFIMRKDPKYIQQMKSRLDDFQRIFSNSFIPTHQRHAMLKLMIQYHNDFNPLAEIELANKNEITQLSKIFARSSLLLDQMALNAKKQYQQIAQETKIISNKTYAIIISVIIAVVFLSVSLAFWIGGKISAPIEKLTNSLLQLSNNILEIDIPGGYRGDEIGKMARSVETLKENSLEMRLLQEKQRQIQQAQIERAGKLETLTAHFEQTVSDLVHGLASASTELDATAKSMSGIASETADQSKSMSTTSQSTTVNIQSVATASEELSASILALSKQVQNTSQASHTASEDVKKASTQIQNLLGASEKIGDIVALINDIAEQTNLLALNATIEAARAGQSGKGFAIVATEVKNLASKTSKATGQISKEVQAVQAQITAAVNAIKNIETKIQDVNISAGAIAAAIEEQTITTQEINRNTQLSSAHMNVLHSNVTYVHEAAQTTGNAAHDVLNSSDELGNQTELLKQRVSEFIGQVKTA